MPLKATAGGAAIAAPAPRRALPEAFLTGKGRSLDFDPSRLSRALFGVRSGDKGVLGEAVAAVAAVDTVLRPDAQDFAGEVFGRLYEGSPALETPSKEAPWTGDAHRVLAGLPEFHALSESVQGDPDLAAFAAASLAQAIAGEIPRILEAQTPPPAPPPGEEDGEEDAPPRGAPPPQAPQPDPSAMDRVIAGLRKGCSSAQSRVQEARGALAGLGCGAESVPPVYEQADPARYDLAQALLASPDVREVLRRAGRIRRLARDAHRAQDDDAREEIVGLEQGGDIARVLPASLVGLRHNGLRLLTLAALVEGRLPQYRLNGKNRQNRGPVVIIADRSGSTAGDPEKWISAAVIAITTAALREKRPVAIGEFSDQVDAAWKATPAGCYRIDPRGRRAPAPVLLTSLLMSVASRRASGGTEFGPPLRFAMDSGVAEDRADFIFITDGCASADAATLERLREAKTRGLRVYGLTVAGGSVSPAVQEIADVTIDLDQQEDAAAALAKAMPKP